MNNRHQKRDKLQWYHIAAPVLCLGIIAGGYATYQYRHHPEKYTAMAAFSARMHAWWDERKHHVTAGLDEKLKDSKNKKVAATKQADSDAIHFEFYNVLPNMSGSGFSSHTDRVAAVNQSTVEKPVIEKATVEKTAEKTTTEPPRSLFTHDELEREMAEDLKPVSYFIQVASFSNAATAERIRHSLEADGLTPKVVKAYVGDSLVYRVQLGPYADKEKATQTSRLLAEHGIHGVIHNYIR